MSKLIGSILTNIIPNQHAWKIKLFSHWDSIIGNMKDKVRIEKVTDTSIELGVCHATWAQELFFLAPVIKNKINTILKEEKIQNIKFKTVLFKKKDSKNTSTKKDSQNKGYTCQQEYCLSIVEHGVLNSISNQDLTHALGQFYIRCKKNTG